MWASAHCLSLHLLCLQRVPSFILMSLCLIHDPVFQVCCMQG